MGPDNKMSPEQLNKFTKNLDKAIQGHYKQVIKEALAGEAEISNKRLSYLETYFDSYSKGLNSISKKQDELFRSTKQLLSEFSKEMTRNLEKATKADKAPSGRAKGEKNINQNTSKGKSANTALPEDVHKALQSVVEIEGTKFAKQLVNTFKQTLENEAKNNDYFKGFTSKPVASVSRYQTPEIPPNANSAAESQLTAEDLAKLLADEDQAQVLEPDKAAFSQLIKDFFEELKKIMDNSAEGKTEEKPFSVENALEDMVQADKDAADAERREAEKELRNRMAKDKAQWEKEAKQAADGELTDQASAKIMADLASKYSDPEKLMKEIISEQREADAKKAAKAADKEAKDLKDSNKNLINEYASLNPKSGTKEEREEKEARRKELVEKYAEDNKLSLEDAEKEVAAEAKKQKQQESVDKAVKAIHDFAVKLESLTDTISEYRGKIDTRLQGSTNKQNDGSYWEQLSKDMMRVGAITPYFKQEKFAENIASLVETGIAFDLKQRAFLMTIQEKIATTFEVADGTLLRLVRIQQEDSTAGRLGMESALTAFLNNMYENTEYLKTVASGIRTSLEEMEALTTGTMATEIEYQVQKWMGSLYSVGMSQTAVDSIAKTLGQLGAGQIEGLTGGDGTSNLLVMAANDAGLSIADILVEGLDASKTNDLMQAMVNYLADIADSSKDNRVVQQQLAGVFGVKASDLKAATNLTSKNSIKNIYGSSLSYNDMLGQLYSMASTMNQRTSISEMIQNIWSNFNYTLATGVANMPVANLVYKLASLLDSTVGGIDIPKPLVMGNGVTWQFTIADAMRIGAMGAGLLGGIGDLISGLGSSFSGSSMLETMGISAGSGLSVTPRGSGTSLGAVGGGGLTTSGSGYVGNNNSSDVEKASMQEASDTQKQTMVEAKEEEESNQLDSINVTTVKIYELLDKVVRGENTFRVSVANYGLSSLFGGFSGAGGTESNAGFSAGSKVNGTIDKSGGQLLGWGTSL